MEVFSSDRKLSELDTENDFSDLLANDYYSAGILQHGNDMTIGSYGMDNDNWLDSFFENDVVLNDKMMSEAMQPPHIKSEHSYSMANSESDSDSPLNLSMEKMDTMLGKDMDNEVFACTTGTTTVPTLTATSRHSNQEQTQNLIATTTTTTSLSTQNSHHIVVKQDHSPNSSNIVIKQEPLDTDSQHVFLKQPTIVLATQQVVPHVHSPSAATATHKADPQIILSKVNIKMETDSFDNIDQTALETVTLPPTPPSSSSSDSEGGQSPNRSAPSSPQRSLSSMRHQTLRALSQPVFSSPIPQSGILVLSEEEKRTLISEGYPIPNKLPLTKQEEKNLKKIRRKIKNKISAQESRRKKKEYLETLEKKMEIYTQENNDLRKKVDSLESNNRSLVTQLQKLQALVGRITKPASPSSTQTGTCLMVLALCFAVFLGGWSPSSLSIAYSPLTMPLSAQPTPAAKVPLGGAETTRDVRVDDYATPNMRSRVLLSLKEEPDEPQTENYRPIIPFSCSDVIHQFWNVIGGVPKDGSNNVQKDVNVGNASLPPAIEAAKTEAETPTKVNMTLKQATMHPDIAANVTYIERVANATA